MIYLIGQLALPLLLTMLAMAFAGWMFAAERAAPKEAAAKRERENLLRDLRFTGDGPVEREVELDAAPTQRLLEIRDGRIAELERALETARARTDEVTSELAATQRGGRLNDLDAAELARLRAAEIERARTVDVEVEPVKEEPVEDENVALQAWRLRYFEQRVRYLESAPRPALTPELEPAVEAHNVAPLQEWVAREASARATFLEDELRRAREAPPETEAAPVVAEAEPFAANADVDMLLRWRLLYLERRVAHLQATPAAQPAPVAPLPAVVQADPDRWKWRARYLEARVRHLEQRPPQVIAAAAAPPEQAPVRAVAAPAVRRAKPPVLPAARHGAPDDLTLIEGVSLLQQTTLYSLGVFHFDQIAAWSEENVAWVDQYLRLQGRIDEQEWLEQARELAAHGPAAARRALESEDA